MNSRFNHWRLSRFLPASAFLFLVPATAHAHGGMTAGELNAIAHPLVVPAHLLVLLGLALWIGQHEAKNLKPFVMVFAPLTGVALGITLTGIITEVPQPFLICVALAIATLVVLERAIPRIAAYLLFGVAALAFGFDSGVEGALSKEVLKALFGIWTCFVIAVLSLSYYVSLCTKWNWTRIGIRVLGSWIIAISLLMLAFSLRK